MIENLRRKLKHLALLDATIEQEWEYRYYSYNAVWSESEEMASLRNGSGGEWFFLFDGENVAFKCTSPVDGLANDFESLKSQVPGRLSVFLNEPAFSMDRGSSIWYLENGNWVKLGNPINDLPDPDVIMKMTASDYCHYSESYFEKRIEQRLVEIVLGGGFDLEIAKKINPDINLELLAEDLEQIGDHN